jgi:hypothetical protein
MTGGDFFCPYICSMNILNKIFTLSTVLIAFSCTNNSGKEALVNNTADTLKTEMIPSVEGFNESHFKTLRLPLNIDTNFVMDADTNDRLNYLMHLRSVMTKGVESELEYHLKDLHMIDSLKLNDGYTEYVKKLDIGMIKNSIAFRIGHVSMAAGKIFLWGIDYGSYEACPYFSGKLVIASVFSTKGEPKHFIVGKRGGAGDPPSTMHEDIVSTIENDGTITTKIITVGDDLDVPGEEKTIRTVKRMLNEGGIEITENKCDTLTKEKAPETPR